MNVLQSIEGMVCHWRFQMISLEFVVTISLTGLVWRLIRQTLKQPKNARVVIDQYVSVSKSLGKMAIITFK